MVMGERHRILYCTRPLCRASRATESKITERSGFLFIAESGSNGWDNFRAPEWKPDAADRPLLRATFETLPDGYHLLVGKDIDDLDEFAKKIKAALLGGIALQEWRAFPSHGARWGGSRPLMRPAEQSCKAALASGYPYASRETNGINSPRTLI